jgi:hypothetical protein
MAAVACAALIAVAGTAAGADSVLLRPKYTPGRTMYAEEQTRMWLKLTRQPDGAERIEVYTGLTLGLLQTVKSASRGRTELLLTVERIAVKMEAPIVAPMGWDTDGVDPPHGTPALGKVLDAIVGRAYTVRLDGKHQVVEVEGLEEIRAVLEPMADALPALMPVVVAFKEDTVRKEWGQSKRVVYPMRRVKVGESWTHTIVDNLGPGGDMRTTYTSTLTQIKKEHGRRVALVDLQARFGQEAGADPATGPMGLQLQFQKGTLTGSATFDVLRGQYVSSRREAKLTFEATGGNDQGQPLARRVQIRVEYQGRALSSGQRNLQKRQRD